MIALLRRVLPAPPRLTLPADPAGDAAVMRFGADMAGAWRVRAWADGRSSAAAAIGERAAAEALRQLERAAARTVAELDTLCQARHARLMPAPDEPVPMEASELREILALCGWSQRHAGLVLPAVGERRMREYCAGKAPIPAKLAAWFRHLRRFPPPLADELAE